MPEDVSNEAVSIYADVHSTKVRSVYTHIAEGFVRGQGNDVRSLWHWPFDTGLEFQCLLQNRGGDLKVGRCRLTGVAEDHDAELVLWQSDQEAVPHALSACMPGGVARVFQAGKRKQPPAQAPENTRIQRNVAVLGP